MMTGHREAENAAKHLRDAFGGRVHDGITIPLGDIDYFMRLNAYGYKASTNFLLDVIIKQNELIADLRQTIKSDQTPTHNVKSDDSGYEVDLINNPSHYNVSGIECIDDMLLAFGPEMTKAFCVCNAWKYRHRAGRKGGSSRSDGLKKAERYMEYASVIEKYKDPLSPSYSYLPVVTLVNRHD